MPPAPYALMRLLSIVPAANPVIFCKIPRYAQLLVHQVHSKTTRAGHVIPAIRIARYALEQHIPSAPPVPMGIF
jgi:hypothetical protein